MTRGAKLTAANCSSMDLTEDLSARILLKNILSTETPRTPITRSSSKASPRRSSRLSRGDAGAQTPQNILRRSLKQKMRESITRKSLTSRRSTASAGLRSLNTPAPTSVLFDDGETPRHILRNILLTEPVKSPVIHENAASKEPQLLSANSSISSKRPSIELSGLDLPDLTLGTAASVAKGLSRKRPHRSLNVTAFEKRLKGADDGGEETEVSIDDHSSLSLSSSTSLSLKTPFVDAWMERRGLQRRVANRRPVTAEEFGAGVNKLQMGKNQDQPQDLNVTSYSEGFTLGLSDHSEPDISADIINCNTALSKETNSMMSSSHVLPAEGGAAAEPQGEGSEGQSERDVETAERQEEEMKRAADGRNDDEEENRVEAQAAKEDRVDSTRSQSEAEEAAPDSQTEEDGVEPEETEEDIATRSEEEAVEIIPDSQTEEEEEDGVDSQPEEDVAARSEEEELTPDCQIEEDEVAVDSQSVEEGEAEEYQTDKEDPTASSQSEEDEHDGKQEEQEDGEQASDVLEQVSRRAQRSQGGLIMPIPSTGGDLLDAAEEGWSAVEQRESSHPCSGTPDRSLTRGHSDGPQSEAKSDDGTENPPLCLVLMDDVVDEHHLSEEATPLAPVEQEEEEEWEDEEGEENEDLRDDTPAFVREKRNFFPLKPLTSPSLLKDIRPSSTSGTNEALATAKPKQVQRKKSPAKNKSTPPKSYLMSVFRHFAKAKVSADVYPVLDEVMDKFLERLADDLETYAGHAKRKTIEVEDAVLLLKRQGHVNDKVPVEVLIEKYLRMEQRKLLIPIATSGNVVVPKKLI